MAQVPCILEFPMLRYDKISEDWLEGQESSRGFSYVQLSVQNCTILQYFMVHLYMARKLIKYTFTPDKWLIILTFHYSTSADCSVGQ
jgi:hypothetical protein